MFPAHRITHEVKNINKKRTFSLLGFLLILAFFPMIFSSSGKNQDTRTQAASLNTQQVPTDEVTANQVATLPPQQQAIPGSQSAIPGSQSASVSTVPAQTYTQLPLEEAYSPQPSIWLFIIPIVITFFTILFY